MAIEIKVPTVGESISEVTLVKWVKADGEWAERDEVIAELESEKATFEINAEKAGLLKHVAKEGDTLAIGDLVCTIDDSAEKPASAPSPEAKEKAPEVAAPAAPKQRSAPTAAAEKPQKEVKSPETVDVKATANKRFAARLAGHWSNGHFFAISFI